jgi:hypothetical protein
MIGVVTLQSNDMATVGASDFGLMTKWRNFKNFLQLPITFIHRKTTKELWTTCTCNFMTFRVLMMKKRHCQGGNMWTRFAQFFSKMWPHEQKQVNLRFILKMISSRICACARNIVFKTNHIIIITWSMTFCTSNIKKHGVARSDKSRIVFFLLQK